VEYRASHRRSIGEVLQGSLSADGWAYVRDAFGCDSGIRAFNATDFIEFLRSGGDPTAVARTPDGGMESIPRSLAERFEQAGGAIWLGHEVTSIEMTDGVVVLHANNADHWRGAPSTAPRQNALSPAGRPGVRHPKRQALRPKGFRR
jgi:hypothetical protein